MHSELPNYPGCNGGSRGVCIQPMRLPLNPEPYSLKSQILGWQFKRLLRQYCRCRVHQRINGIECSIERDTIERGLDLNEEIRAIISSNLKRENHCIISTNTNRLCRIIKSRCR